MEQARFEGRLEGKLDAVLEIMERHEARLNSHSGKIDSLQQQATKTETLVASRHVNWPAVVSSIVAAVSLVIVIVTMRYTGAAP
jgi:hypothetical protein